MVSDSPRSERREVHFSGRVQGVGFRFTTQNLARQFRVSGFVRNLPDGRVQLVAEGEARELDRFLALLGERMEDLIRDVKVDVSAVSGDFDDFSIRY